MRDKRQPINIKELKSTDTSQYVCPTGRYAEFFVSQIAFTGTDAHIGKVKFPYDLFLGWNSHDLSEDVSFFLSMGKEPILIFAGQTITKGMSGTVKEYEVP